MIEKIEQQVPEVSNFDLEITKTKKQLQFFRSLAIFFGGLIVGVALLMTIAFAMSEDARKKAIIEVDNADYTPLVTPTISISTPIMEDLSGFGILSWLSTPKKVSNPDILVPSSDNNYTAFAELGTYEVGKFKNGGSLLVTFVQPEGPSSPMIFRVIFDKNKYYLIESLISDDYVKKQIDTIFNKNKITLISYQIKELMTDGSASVNQLTFLKNDNGYFLPQFITSLKDFSTVGTTPNGDMLVTYSPVSDFTDLKMRNFYLKLKDFTLVPHNLAPSVSYTDNQVPFFNLNNGSKNSNVYNALRVGCGGLSSTSVVKNDSLISDKEKIGIDNTTDIYQIKNSSSALIKYLYNSYKQGRDYPSAPPILSIDQFTQSPNHIIYQEKNGDWALFTNPEFSVQAECGKPVIYLYPKKDTQVTVKVGADITKSEPLYPQNGWTVLAHPNGQLDYQNLVYPNLFWEGTGYGLYPSLGNRGFVVPQSKLIFTINSQLKQQGLNAQESADFMEFWTDKLPSTPYVRLTWLTTSEMNVLAPLKVVPSPQTAIRIFLDFEGLQKPIILTPQKLSAPARNGFTLVEWGGLLRN